MILLVGCAQGESRPAPPRSAQGRRSFNRPPRRRPSICPAGSFSRAPGLERAGQQRPTQGQSPRRAHVRRHEDLEDPARLPPSRPRRLLGHHRSSPPPQPRPRRLTDHATGPDAPQRVTRRPLGGGLLVAGVRPQHPLKAGVRGFARCDVADIDPIVGRMTRHEIEPESWWVRLDREMGPGLYAIRVLAGLPPRCWPRTAAATERRERRQSEGVTR